MHIKFLDNLGLNMHYRRITTVQLYWSVPCSMSILCPQKRSHFYFLNNSAKNEPILIIFGTLNPEET